MKGSKEPTNLDDFIIRPGIEEFEDEFRSQIKDIPNIRIYNPSTNPSRKLGLRK